MKQVNLWSVRKLVEVPDKFRELHQVQCLKMWWSRVPDFARLFTTYVLL